jgi:hypothetical protein
LVGTLIKISVTVKSFFEKKTPYLLVFCVFFGDISV